MVTALPCATLTEWPRAEVYVSKSSRRRMRYRRVAARKAQINSRVLIDLISGAGNEGAFKFNSEADVFVPSDFHIGVEIDEESLVFKVDSTDLARANDSCRIPIRRELRETLLAEVLPITCSNVEVMKTEEKAKDDLAGCPRLQAALCMGRGKGKHVHKLYVRGCSSLDENAANRSEGETVDEFTTASDPEPKLKDKSKTTQELKFWERLCGKGGIRTIKYISHCSDVCGMCMGSTGQEEVAYYCCPCCGTLPCCVHCDGGAHAEFVWKLYRKHCRKGIQPGHWQFGAQAK